MIRHTRLDGVTGVQTCALPICIALTGQMHGPDLAGLVEVLGYERAAKRIERTLA